MDNQMLKYKIQDRLDILLEYVKTSDPYFLESRARIHTLLEEVSHLVRGLENIKVGE